MNSLALGAYALYFVLAFFWHHMEEAWRWARGINDHSLMPGEEEANRLLWNLLQEEDPQWLKDMGVGPPPEVVYDMEVEAERLERREKLRQEHQDKMELEARRREEEDAYNRQVFNDAFRIGGTDLSFLVNRNALAANEMQRQGTAYPYWREATRNQCKSLVDAAEAMQWVPGRIEAGQITTNRIQAGAITAVHLDRLDGALGDG